MLCLLFVTPAKAGVHPIPSSEKRSHRDRLHRDSAKDLS
jgi:hypothetical protein